MSENDPIDPSGNIVSGGWQGRNINAVTEGANDGVTVNNTGGVFKSGLLIGNVSDAAGSDVAGTTEAGSYSYVPGGSRRAPPAKPSLFGSVLDFVFRWGKRALRAFVGIATIVLIFACWTANVGHAGLIIASPLIACVGFLLWHVLGD